MHSSAMSENICLHIEKIIDDLELEKSIKCFSKYKEENITNYLLQEKEKREELCLRINYELWFNNLNYNKSCK